MLQIVMVPQLGRSCLSWSLVPGKREGTPGTFRQLASLVYGSDTRRTEAKFSRTFELVVLKVELLQVAQLPKLTGDGACGRGRIQHLHEQTRIQKFALTLELILVQ